MEDFLGFLRFSWDVTQLNLIFKPHNGFTKNRLKLKKTYLFVLILNFAFYGIIFSTLLFKKPFDLKYFGDALSSTSVLSINLIETLILYFNRNQIQEIMKKLPKKFSADEVKKFKLKRLIWRTKITYTLPGIWASAAVVFYVSKSISSENREFFIEFNYPFDVKHPLIFYAININMLTVLTTLQFFIITNQVLKYGMITVISVQFRKLSEDLKSITEKILYQNRLNVLRPKATQKFILAPLPSITPDREDIKAQIISIINRHNELFDIRNKIEKLFTFSFFYNFVTGSVIISALIFSIIPEKEYFVLILAVINVLLNANYLRLQFDYGQVLKDASLSVADGVYECGWENLEDEELKQMLMMIKIRSQKSAALTAMKFIDIDLEQFTKMMTTFYSYYTFIRNFYYNHQVS